MSTSNVKAMTANEADRNLKGFSEFMNTQSFTAPASGVITAQTYFWGFHIVIPEAAWNELKKAKDVATSFTSLAGSGFGVAGCPGLSAIAFIMGGIMTAESAVASAVDQGKGIYLSWTWFQVPLMMANPLNALPLPTAIV